MDYLNEHGEPDGKKIVHAIKDINSQILEEQEKEKPDRSRISKLRYEQLLRGMYLQCDPNGAFK